MNAEIIDLNSFRFRRDKLSRQKIAKLTRHNRRLLEEEVSIVVDGQRNMHLVGALSNKVPYDHQSDSRRYIPRQSTNTTPIHHSENWDPMLPLHLQGTFGDTHSNVRQLKRTEGVRETTIRFGAAITDMSDQIRPKNSPTDDGSAA